MVDWVTVTFKVDSDTRDAIVRAANAENLYVSEFLRYWMQLSFQDELLEPGDPPQRPEPRRPLNLPRTPVAKITGPIRCPSIHELACKGHTAWQIAHITQRPYADVVAEMSG